MSLGLSYPVPMIGAANAVAGIVGVMTAIWKSFPIGEYFVFLQYFTVSAFYTSRVVVFSFVQEFKGQRLSLGKDFVKMCKAFI